MTTTMPPSCGPSFSSAEANENERRWNDDKIDRKNQDSTNNYDKTRMKLNFEVVPHYKFHFIIPYFVLTGLLTYYTIQLLNQEKKH